VQKPAEPVKPTPVSTEEKQVIPGVDWIMILQIVCIVVPAGIVVAVVAYLIVHRARSQRNK
jgi:hypothetical protein